MDFRFQFEMQGGKWRVACLERLTKTEPGTKTCDETLLCSYRPSIMLMTYSQQSACGQRKYDYLKEGNNGIHLVAFAEQRGNNGKIAEYCYSR